MHTHNIHKHTTSTIISLLTILTFTSGVILTSPKVSADSSAGVTVTVTVPAVCSLTANSDSVSNTIYPGNSGLIGTSTIKAICNDPAGLAVYAVAYTNNNYGNTNLESTVGGATNTIGTNATASGTPAQSEWHMTLTQVSGDYVPTIVTGFDSAHAIPSAYTKVAYRDTMTDMGTNATGANFTASFNAYIANNQAAGTYTGKVKFLLVHPSTHDAPITPVAVAHQICYYGNDADEGSMACQTTIDGSSYGLNTNFGSSSSVTLRAPNFSRAGYGFTGWNTKEDGTGTQYGPMETITMTQDIYNNGLMLFAQWQAAETGVTMQTFDDTVSPYSTADVGTVIALRDTRDNDVYAVAKLQDGKWWMIENLRLDYDANITTNNTQSNNEAWGGVFAGLAEPEFAGFIDTTTVQNSLYTTDTTSTSLRIITGSNKAYRFPRYNNDNTANRQTNATSTSNTYGYGNYYTWAAAVADTTAYSNTNQSVTGTSLCPTGWHLPKGGNKSNEVNNEWWNLFVTIVGANPTNYDSYTSPYYTGSQGSDVIGAMRHYPINYVYSGYFYDSSAYGRGTYNYYWSSTVSGSSTAYTEHLNSYDTSGMAYPGDSNKSKSNGYAVRCVAD